jgi:hypothetical protein
MNTNLVYTFINNKSDIECLQLFLITLMIYCKYDRFDILVISSEELIPEIDLISENFYIQLKTTLKQSIFDYENIRQYNKLLYLEPAIIIQGDISVLFELEDMMYVLKNNGVILQWNIKDYSGSIDTEFLDTMVFVADNENPVSPEKDNKIIMNYFYGDTSISKKNRMLYHLYHILDLYNPVEANDNITFTQYAWGSGNMTYESNNLVMSTWGRGFYKCLTNKIYYMGWSHSKHISIFNDTYDRFTSITLNTMEIQERSKNNALKDTIPEPYPRDLVYHVSDKKLIYFCAFHKKEYLFLLRYLLVSIKLFSKIDKDIDFLLFTSPDFNDTVYELTKDLDINIKVKFFNFTSQHEAGCARIHIFEYENINDYSKILYLDTDILIQRDLMKVFDYLVEDKLYATKEYDIYGAGHGAYFFDFNIFDKNLPSLNSGVLLFRNSPAIRAVFHDINTHIENLKKRSTIWPGCMDQPFISFHFIKNYMCNLVTLTPLICLSEHTMPPLRESSEHIIIQFVWPIGNALHKMDRMKRYLNTLLEPK